MEVVVRVSDEGSGLNKIQVTGLGYDREHSVSEAADGVFRITIPAAGDPAALAVTATDNVGLRATASLTGLRFEGSQGSAQEVEPNSSQATAQILTVPTVLAGNVQRTDPSTMITVAYSSTRSETVPFSDWYAVTVPATTRIDVRLAFSHSGRTDLDLFLFDSARNILQWSLGDNQATGNYTEGFEYLLLPRRTYYLAIQPYTCDSRETYTLTLAPK